MVKNAQVTPCTDAIIKMPQAEAEKLFFWNEDFWEVKELVERILEEIENLKDTPEKGSRNKLFWEKL